MKYPQLETTAAKLQYTLIWVVYAALQAVAFKGLLDIPNWLLIADATFHATIFGVFGVLLCSILSYGNFNALTAYQRVINYVALALLTIGLWLGLGVGALYLIYDQGVIDQFIALLPLRGLIGLILYLLVIQQCSLQLFKGKTAEENESETQASAEVPSEVQLELIDRISVKSGVKIHVILVPDIFVIQSDGDYVQIITEKGKYLKEQTMKYFDEHLPNDTFVRVHRTAIVNIEKISHIELYEKQSQLLTLKNGLRIKASPAGYKLLRTKLNL